MIGVRKKWMETSCQWFTGSRAISSISYSLTSPRPQPHQSWSTITSKTGHTQLSWARDRSWHVALLSISPILQGHQKSFKLWEAIGPYQNMRVQSSLQCLAPEIAWTSKLQPKTSISTIWLQQLLNSTHPSFHLQSWLNMLWLEHFCNPGAWLQISSTLKLFARQCLPPLHLLQVLWAQTYVSGGTVRWESSHSIQ